MILTEKEQVVSQPRGDWTEEKYIPKENEETKIYSLGIIKHKINANKCFFKIVEGKKVSFPLKILKN